MNENSVTKTRQNGIIEKLRWKSLDMKDKGD